MPWDYLPVLTGDRITPAPFNELREAGIERLLWEPPLVPPNPAQSGRRITSEILASLRSRIVASVATGMWKWPTTGINYKAWSTTTEVAANNIFYQAFGAWNWRDPVEHGYPIKARALNDTAKVLELMKYVLTPLVERGSYGARRSRPRYDYDGNVTQLGYQQQWWLYWPHYDGQTQSNEAALPYVDQTPWEEYSSGDNICGCGVSTYYFDGIGHLVNPYYGCSTTRGLKTYEITHSKFTPKKVYTRLWARGRREKKIKDQTQYPEEYMEYSDLARPMRVGCYSHPSQPTGNYWDILGSGNLEAYALASRNGTWSNIISPTQSRWLSVAIINPDNSIVDAGIEGNYTIQDGDPGIFIMYWNEVVTWEFQTSTSSTILMECEFQKG